MSGRGLLFGSVLPAQAFRLPSRFRAISAAAPAPNRRIIGGAGTGVPPLEPPLLPPLDDEVELDELDAEEAEDEDELLVELDVPPPKLDEEEVVDTLPLDVEDELPPVEVEVDEPPVEVDVEEPPVEVELPPVEVELPPVDVELPPVELPPVEVELDTPLDVDTPLEVETFPLEVETPLEVEVETLIIVPLLPPDEELLPPKKPPEKKPPPKPKPLPPEPPTTTKPLDPPLDPPLDAIGGGGGGAKTGGMIMREVVTAPAPAPAAHIVRRTVRRTTWPLRVRRKEVRVPVQLPPLRAWLPVRTSVPVRAWADCMRDGRAGGFSARCTAPPPTTAPPQVQAQSCARAILTDMSSILFLALG